jgi:dUTPase
MAYTYEAFEQADALQSHEEVLIMKPSIAVTYGKTNPNIPDLIKGHHDDVGHDISVIAIKEVLSNRTALYETGITLTIPMGYFVVLVPRSSIAKRGYFMTNSIGIIDPGYRGTIAVSLTKISDDIPDLEFP